MAGGGQSTGGWHFTTRDWVGSREKFRWIERGTATDGGEVGKRGERTIQKTGEEKGGAGPSLKV